MRKPGESPFVFSQSPFVLMDHDKLRQVVVPTLIQLFPPLRQMTISQLAIESEHTWKRRNRVAFLTLGRAPNCITNLSAFHRPAGAVLSGGSAAKLK